MPAFVRLLRDFGEAKAGQMSLEPNCNKVVGGFGRLRRYSAEEGGSGAKRRECYRMLHYKKEPKL